MSASTFFWKCTHNPRRRAHHPCAHCGTPTLGLFGAGNIHVGALFCGDMDCYVASLYVHVTIQAQRRTETPVTQSDVARLATLPLSTICTALVALRRTGTAVIEGRDAQELWRWIEEHAQGEESEAAA